MAVSEETGMHHAPFGSLDELLAPETLTRLCREPVHTVRCGSFSKGHSASGSRFLGVETNGGEGPRFVVKRSSPACDWIVRGTGDELGREMLVWTSGLLDRLPAEVTHPVLACASDGEGWAILMRDVSEVLLPDPLGESPLDRADHHRYLDALAALHIAFWNQPQVVDPALGYCSPWHRFAVFSPQTGQREADHPNPIVREMREGWDLLWTLVEPDVAALLGRLLENPAPLCAALARYPQTVVHGDPRSSNLGMLPGASPRVVLLDWQLVGPGTPGLDLAWYLANLGIKAPVDNDTTVAWYREALARRLGSAFDEGWWQPQWELSLLGHLVRLGWGHAWDAIRHPSATIREWTRADLTWWFERARDGARWL
jgi:hypothetical protein